MKQCFDQDCFKDDKDKWYDASTNNTELREALIRRFKSRLATLKTTCDTFMKGISLLSTFLTSKYHSKSTNLNIIRWEYI